MNESFDTRLREHRAGSCASDGSGEVTQRWNCRSIRERARSTDPRTELRRQSAIRRVRTTDQVPRCHSFEVFGPMLGAPRPHLSVRKVD
eukprot:3113770-Prymnesium_polylepis.2